MGPTGSRAYGSRGRQGSWTGGARADRSRPGRGSRPEETSGRQRARAADEARGGELRSDGRREAERPARLFRVRERAGLRAPGGAARGAGRQRGSGLGAAARGTPEPRRGIPCGRVPRPRGSGSVSGAQIDRRGVAVTVKPGAPFGGGRSGGRAPSA